ncbi:polyprenyl glycosylphosphotransferase [Kocuria rosea subsp. polaris]|uniref:Polyprenyl glycosylphosphotransferase n=1 Tax=Kocuria rosea subsp. polaris TaxID=136273 RepID=A0A0W8IA35_KOCRO|nr:sugar transferase [Kocuria polaris]KUG56715.1 polyprenyl glycosylphosphotransferase [Kocuria polaris]
MLKQTTATRSTAWRENYVNSLRRIDAVALALAVGAAQIARFGFDDKVLPLENAPMPYWLVGLLLAIAWWMLLDLRGTRDVRLIGYWVEETREVVSATLMLFGALAIVSFALDIPVARSYVILALPIGLGLLLLARGLMRRHLLVQRSRGLTMSRTLVVGRQPGAAEFVQYLQDNADPGFTPVAVYSPPAEEPLSAALATVQMPPNLWPENGRASVEEILNTCREYQIETLVLAASAPLSSEQVRHLSWHLADENIRLILDTGLTDIAGPRIHTQHLAGLPLIHVSTPKMTLGKKWSKRAVDIVGSVSALLVLSPVILALALIVKLHDGGPILFAQERIGMEGRRFKMLKFRSMRTDASSLQKQLMAEAGSNALLFHLKNDPRVTSPGRWMRKYSLDELPQFVNVLKGEMSLVGPRPQVEAEVAEYEDYAHRRLRVLPGITGLWQVSGRADLGWEQTVRLDLYYVENWSPVLDFVILLRTFKAVVAREGAY